MNLSLIQKINDLKTAGRKSLAVLIDPDNVNQESLQELVMKALQASVDFFFVGGSLIVGTQFHQAIKQIKKLAPEIPVVIFPGSNMHIDAAADGILLLSLISGRNPEFLIGQHVIAAPILKRSKLEILSTGYMLVDAGRQTTVSYISNTSPIPRDKPDIAACTALAAEMLGMRLIYMDAGSGALHPIPQKMIAHVKRVIDIPLIVGGGIDNVEKAMDAYKAGADILVIGNALEKDPSLLDELGKRLASLNAVVVHH